MWRASARLILTHWIAGAHGAVHAHLAGAANSAKIFIRPNVGTTFTAEGHESAMERDLLAAGTTLT